MHSLLQDVRFALRTLGKSPGFTAVSLLTLAIGIGANTAIFSFVDAALLRPLPYADADRIMRVLEKPPGFPRNGISTLNYLDWAHDNTVFEYSVAHRTSEMGIRAALGVTPRSLLSLILTHGLWMTAIGLVIGIGGALGLPSLLKAFLFGVGSWDPLTLTSAAAILGIVALLACYLPARRVTKIDPMVTLRYE